MDYTIIFKILGIFGLISIIFGVLLKRKKKEDLAFIIGGFFLTVYSFYIKDIIFIVLQIVFIVVAIYDYFRKGKNANK